MGVKFTERRISRRIRAFVIKYRWNTLYT